MKPNLEQYLKGNFEKGIVDHMIRVSHIDQSDKPHFYIHPHGYDGDTLDFVVNENQITQKHVNQDASKAVEANSNLTVSVSVKDTGLFERLIGYTQEVVEILKEYPLSEQHRKQIEDITEKFLEKKVKIGFRR